MRNFPGVPHSLAEDSVATGSLPTHVLEDIVGECAAAANDPEFFVRLLDAVLFYYGNWEHTLHREAQLAACALRRLEALKGADAVELAWERAAGCLRDVVDEEAA